MTNPNDSSRKAAEEIIAKARQDIADGTDTSLPPDQQQEYVINAMAAIIRQHRQADTIRLDLLESTHAFIHVSQPPDAAPVFTVIANNITAHGTTLRAACDAALKL